MKIAKIISVAVIVIGVIFGILTVSDCYKLVIDKPYALESMSKDCFEDDKYYSGSMEFVVDRFTTKKTSNSIGYIPLGSKNSDYYLTMINDAFVVMAVPSSNQDLNDSFNESVKYTSSYKSGASELEPDKFTVYTKSTKMSDDVKKALYDYFEQNEMSKEQCDQMVEDCVLQCVDKDFRLFIFVPVFSFMSAITALIIFLKIRWDEKKANVVYLNESPETIGELTEHDKFDE